MLSYYTGDFEWAQNQLEALKGSTTKLISNDAISLSTFITENYGIDSNDVPLKLFASAQLLLYQKQYEKANLKFDTISNIYSDHILMDDILFKKAQIAQQKNDSSSAIKYYKKIIEKYNEDLLLDDAIFHLAELYHSINNDSKIALQYYQDILINHPDSIYVTEARKKYRRLRGDNLN
jgi:tetratricopeptide (TPR) repeat protein